MSDLFGPGDVVRVIDWPGTVGERFVVDRIVGNPASQWPLQVYCWTLDPGDRLGSFRAFPLDVCMIDHKKTARWRDRLQRRLQEAS